MGIFEAHARLSSTALNFAACPLLTVPEDYTDFQRTIMWVKNDEIAAGGTGVRRS